MRSAGSTAADRADGPAPWCSLESDDVDASLDAVRAAGGAIVEPLEPYPGGRRFTFTDPAGNWLGVYQSDPAQT